MFPIVSRNGQVSTKIEEHMSDRFIHEFELYYYVWKKFSGRTSLQDSGRAYSHSATFELWLLFLPEVEAVRFSNVSNL